MAEKKPAAKKAASTPKTGTKTSGTKKVGNSAKAKTKTTKKPAAKKPQKPDWLKPAANDYAVATENYRKVVEDYNEKFRTSWNPWRCRPQVFFTIHAELVKYYNEQN
jgi:hypothetical protein